MSDPSEVDNALSRTNGLARSLSMSLSNAWFIPLSLRPVYFIGVRGRIEFGKNACYFRFHFEPAETNRIDDGHIKPLPQPDDFKMELLYRTPGAGILELSSLPNLDPLGIPISILDFVMTG